MRKIISVQGYKAFTGVMRVSWPDKPSEEIYGDWLYRPDTNCWYRENETYPADICVLMR